MDFATEQGSSYQNSEMAMNLSAEDDILNMLIFFFFFLTTVMQKPA